MAYENEILIKLNREYSRDEMFAFSIRKIKEQAVEIGKLSAYISELEDNPINKDFQSRNELLYQENIRLREKNKTLENKGKDVKSQFKVKELSGINKELIRQIKLCKKENARYKFEKNKLKKETEL